MQNIFTKKRFFVVVFLLLFHLGFSEEIITELPLLTTRADNMIRNDFSGLMMYVTKYPNNDLYAINMGTSLFGPFELQSQASFPYIKNINNWISVPFFIAGTASDYMSPNPQGSLFAGSGIIIKNRFFYLGLTGGLLLDESTPKVFDFGIFPIFNTAEYPILGSFLEKFYGYFFSSEPEISDTRIDNLNYLLNISFKRILGLSVLELYTRSGYNDFRPEYDLSNMSVSISEWGGMIGGKHIFEVYTGIDSSIYRTNVYGLRIGGERFMVDLNYLKIEGLKSPIYDSYELEVWNNYVTIGYKDYEYPFSWLDGFPSVTLNFYMPNYLENSKFFVRFNTLQSANTLALPYIPDVGVVYQGETGSFIVTWMFPAGFSVSIRFFGGF